MDALVWAACALGIIFFIHTHLLLKEHGITKQILVETGFKPLLRPVKTLLLGSGTLVRSAIAALIEITHDEYLKIK